MTLCSVNNPCPQSTDPLEANLNRLRRSATAKQTDKIVDESEITKLKTLVSNLSDPTWVTDQLNAANQAVIDNQTNYD